jgi:hypothetical protein
MFLGGGGPTIFSLLAPTAGFKPVMSLVFYHCDFATQIFVYTIMNLDSVTDITSKLTFSTLSHSKHLTLSLNLSD